MNSHIASIIQKMFIYIYILFSREISDFNSMVLLNDVSLSTARYNSIIIGVIFPLILP